MDSTWTRVASSLTRSERGYRSIVMEGEADVSGEDLKRQIEREHGELVQELRSLIPGAEVLFGFLLAVRFTGQFSRLSADQQHVYYATLLSVALALVLFLAPGAYHRVRFRDGDKGVMLRKGNIEVIVGTAFTLLAFTGVVFLVTDLKFSRPVAFGVGAGFFLLAAWLWWGLALVRKLRGLHTLR